MKLKIFCTSLAILLCSTRIYALNVDSDHKIIDDVTVIEESECTHIKIGFNFPIRYLRHYPDKSGNEFTIQFLPFPITPEDKAALLSPEVTIPDTYSKSLFKPSEIRYERVNENNYQLLLYFFNQVSIQIRQGDDFRSITTIVSKSEESKC